MLRCDTILPNKPWIDAECWKVIDERRQAKKKCFQGEQYRKLCKKVSKTCSRAKRRWLQERGTEAEQAHRAGITRDVYKLIKQISGNRSVKPGIGIKAYDGKMIRQIKERWFEYGKQLHAKRQSNFHVQGSTTVKNVEQPEEQEPEVLRDEVRRAVNKLKNNKAPGMDNISSEMLKAGGETTVTVLKSIIDKIWENGDWPQD